MMQTEVLISHIEALIFASEKPLSLAELAEYVGTIIEKETNKEHISKCIEAVKEKYSTDVYPFELKEIGGGFQFLTKKAYHNTVMQLNGDKYIKKLSSSAMETLSIIAYKQPVTKAEIEYVRGVSSDYSIQRLLEKELIIIAGRKEDAVGKPLVYATSKAFMDYLGINSPDQLPVLKEISNTDIVIPVDAEEAVPKDIAAFNENVPIKNPTLFEQENDDIALQLVVASNGELKQA